MFIGAACKDGDHKGENDPKSKDNDVDTATGKRPLFSHLLFIVLVIEKKYSLLTFRKTMS